MDFKTILSNGVEITSSGTTGTPKKIFRTPENLTKCNQVAIEAQKISKNSSVLTVTRMTHAGGLLAQSLPAYSIGANVEIKQFNPFTFLKDLQNHTHTFLAPAQMQALMQTKNFNTCDLSGKWILGGSDPVSWEIIEAFVSKGAIVQPNWGMSEIGPIAINIVFDSMDKVQQVKQSAPEGYTVLGDTYWCEWKIDNFELVVKSDTCIYDDWFYTKDLVSLDMRKRMYYHKRILE